MGNGTSGGVRGMHMARRATVGGATARAPRASAKPKTAAAREREALAALHTLSGAADEKATHVAVLEEALREMRDSPAFAARVRAAALQVPEAAAPKAKAARPPMPPVINPAAFVGHNPLARTNPYQMAEGYGRAQLRAVLLNLPPGPLREAVQAVKERQPGTAPKGRTNAAMVDYVVEHVAGPGY